MRATLSGAHHPAQGDKSTPPRFCRLEDVGMASRQVLGMTDSFGCHGTRVLARLLPCGRDSDRLTDWQQAMDMEPMELIPVTSCCVATGRGPNMVPEELIPGTRRSLIFSCLRHGTNMEPAELIPVPTKDCYWVWYERGTTETRPRYQPQ